MESDGEVALSHNADKITLLHQKMERRAEEKAAYTKKLNIIQSYWMAKARTLEEQIDDCSREIETSEQELEELGYHNQAVRMPGPRSLAFVDSDIFTLVATTIVTGNVITMLVELWDPAATPELLWLDIFFVLLYIVELVIKAVYKQRHLLIGPCSVVGWNWLDLVICVSAVLDMWVRLGIAEGSDMYCPTFLSYVRILRLLRLVRVVKVIRVFFWSDFSWTDEHAFQSFIMGIISLNTVLLALEADYPDVVYWVYFENLLLAIFLFEFLCRLRHRGLSYFYIDWFWNWLDMTIVIGGVIDEWLVPIIIFVKEEMGLSMERSGRIGQLFMVLRVARLARILRLVRLVKGIPELFSLILGIGKAMAGMSWVVVLVMAVLYIFALLGVKLVGHGLAFSEVAPQEVHDTFPNIRDAMFNLFLAMNADMSLLMPLFEYAPNFKNFMMLFVILTNWAIFSILTGVVSDNMAAASDEAVKEYAEAARAEREKRAMEKLKEMFRELDRDGSGTIGKSEFDDLLSDGLRRDEFCDAANLSPLDLQELFSLLSFKKKGDKVPVIHRDDFLAGLKKESSTVSERSMMRLEKRVQTLDEDFDIRIQRLETLMQSVIDEVKDGGLS
eukprot:CAMPEP_0170588242 /NCGR_PEP_ID=MMETSP0224-20130122/10725_1 /TAXON_ID=285029 /ORGANISM="Togula jolla, Strain CCCM 725" /LENGTH=613 /DNA_ID=CAMNT_0010911945 /DNA_START=67 /DNA_END=1908 /DNA_ORIENTATION=-